MLIWGTPDGTKGSYIAYTANSEGTKQFAIIEKVNEHNWIVGDNDGLITHHGSLEHAKRYIRRKYVKSAYYMGEPIE